VDIITSRSNPAIKRIRALQIRKEREAANLFFIEGIRIVAEAVDLDADIETLVAAPDLLTSEYGRSLVSSAETAGVSVLAVSADVFRSLSDREGPQGLGAVVRQRWSTLEVSDPHAGLCWIALERIADPGNLGTILRTADAVGAAGLILLGPSADPHDPTALRASMGAIFSQHLVRASWEAFVAWTRANGCQLVGAAGSAETDYREAAFRQPLLLLMGSEREGLTAEQQAACDLLVRVPMVGRSDSLNLAVATGALLYQIFDRFHPIIRHLP
jgi:TrmH family RNA methyltransferase